ncbi:MAG: glycosyl hydrolase family 8 [Cytophagaceae bacterium]|jgi:endo-1,4-beta-D-glucanase Y|nr:glycosyl hydrolase family 8 [Cytophagaceae bacterium]
MLSSVKSWTFLLICSLFLSVQIRAQINTPSGAVVPFGSNPNYGGNGIMPSTAVLPSGGTYGRSQDAADAYIEWKANYTESCGGGRIRVRFDEPNRTVSEGIAYGMQLAAYAADKNLFDGLYTYWKAYVTPNTNSRTGKLMNWRIEGCGTGVSGTGSAADADVDAAWALLIAETQWPSLNTPYDYLSEANNMLNSIKDLEVNSSGQLINGDGWGFGNNCRNPSYQSPPYYKVFATVNTGNTAAWNAAVNGAYTLINANDDNTTGLVSDWSDQNGVRNTCNPGGLGYAATDGYGYDACRNPWRMAQDVLWNNDAQARSICTKIAAYINSRGVNNIGGPLYQNGTNYPGFARNATFVSTFAMAVMGTNSTYQSLMDQMYTATRNTKDQIRNVTLSGYFGNTLRCISLFMMTGNFWKYGTTSIQEINVRQGVTQIPNGGTFDFQNQQTTPPASSGKMLTFTIENLGFASLNLTGTTRVVLGGTNANQFSLTQPSASSLALGATTTFNVTFTPTTTGTKTATLSIASNDPDENPYVITITGTGTANTTAPRMTVFDTVNVLTTGSNVAMGTFTGGTRGYKVFKITNTGDAPLNITNATFGNVAFSMTTPANFSTPLVIPVGGKSFITIGFNAPASPATTNSTVTFSTNDPNAPTLTLNLSASSAACSNNPSNKILMDYDGYRHLIQPWNPTGTWSPTANNPSVTPANLSPTVASYVRATTGDYDIIRYYNCGSIAGSAHSNSTYIPFAVNASNPTIQILVYSPGVGIPITVAPQKPTGTTNAWAPLIADYSSNVTVTTTKANQWELLTFDMGNIIRAGVAGDMRALDIQIDPLRAWSGAPANAAIAARTFYIDEIKYGINPCLSDNSGILQDYNDHINVTLDYTLTALTAPVPNPSMTGSNTSTNVGRFIKTVNTSAYDDGFRYNGCNNFIDLSTKKYISMLVYAPAANVPIQIGAKIPDGPDADAFPDDADTDIQNTVFANRWHRIYFDLSAITTAQLPTVRSIDIFFDPNDISSGGTFYFDDIRLETALPCVTGIPATNILNDFEDNRYLGVVFPGTTGTSTFNSIAANPSLTGINTSSTVGTFVRNTGTTTGTSLRLSACQNSLNLAPGNTLIDVKVYAPVANVKVTMSLKTATGVTVSDVTEVVATANTWTNLRFDHSAVLNATNVAFIELIMDPDGTSSGATTTVTQRTYYIDDIRYAPPAPEINVRALTSPTQTNVLTGGTINLGTVGIGTSSTPVNFSIQNNGLQTLNLTGTPNAIQKSGTNAADFIVTTTSSFSTTVGALGATGFTIVFTPTGTASGIRTATITIPNNDSNEGSYTFTVTGTATAPVIQVLNGSITTSPIIANNNAPAINIGSAVVSNAAPAYTLAIKNNGTGPLSITSVTSSSTAFVVSALTPVSPIAANSLSTFTVTATPAAIGANTAFLTIASNDPATPSYRVNLSVTGTAAPTPQLTVRNGTAVVSNNATPAISVGSAIVGSPASSFTGFTITNTGTANLTVTSITGSSGFVVSALSPASPIAPNGVSSFSVTATPAAVGANNGTITIATNDPSVPSFTLNVTVTGTAAATPQITVRNGTTSLTHNATPAISVGTAVVGSPAAAFTGFSITNTGTANLTVTSITGSSGFVVSALSPASPIAPNGVSSFSVTATPAASGTNTGTITIVTNDPSRPSFTLNVSVTGTTATSPQIQVKNGTTIINHNATPAINIGSAVIGNTVTYTSFSITNTGTANLTITSITPSSIFGATSISPVGPIAPNATVTFNVTGSPSVVGANNGTITIASNSTTNASFVINVTVTGLTATSTLGALDAAAVDVYPNPNNGLAYLEFNQMYDNVVVTVLNSTGATVSVDRIGSVSGVQSLNTAALPAGIYFIEIATAQGKLIKRLVKE